MLRSVGSITTGFATWVLLFVGSNSLIKILNPATIEVEAPTNATGVLLLILALSVLSSIIAGWITFKVDRVRALGSSLILGVLLLAGGIVLQSQYWTMLPLWYHLAFLGALIPGVLVGYRLGVTRS